MRLCGFVYAEQNGHLFFCLPHSGSSICPWSSTVWWVIFLPLRTAHHLWLWKKSCGSRVREETLKEWWEKLFLAFVIMSFQWHILSFFRRVEQKYRALKTKRCLQIYSCPLLHCGWALWFCKKKNSHYFSNYCCVKHYYFFKILFCSHILKQNICCLTKSCPTAIDLLGLIKVKKKFEFFAVEIIILGTKYFFRSIIRPVTINLLPFLQTALRMKIRSVTLTEINQNLIRLKPLKPFHT